MSEPTRNVIRRSGIVLSDQRGVVVPIVTIGLLALLAVAGLALDGSHALANKTRMQNTTDAAALAAAKVLDQTEDTALATAAAVSLFGINADGAGNHELNGAYDGGEISVTVQYSETVVPFTPGSPDGPFVRVIATGFDTLTTLSRVLGIGEIPTPATAVAGPSGPIGFGEGAQICDVAPIAVCHGDVPDTQDALRVLKPAPSDTSDIGPGNYKILRITGPGDTKENMAGSSDVCATIGEEKLVDPQPGVNSGPISQGFNTRFNEYRSLSKPPYYPDEYIEEQGPNFLKSCGYTPDGEDRIDFIFLTASPPNQPYCNHFGDKPGFDPDDPSTWGDPGDPWEGDYVQYADEINYNYCNYSGGTSCNDDSAPHPASGPGEFVPDGVAGRRILTFPIVDCNGLKKGTSEAVEIVGGACFFMLQSLPEGQGGGKDGGNGQLFGQFLSECNVHGTAGIIDPTAPGPSSLLYKIQLYKDPDSGDS